MKSYHVYILLCSDGSYYTGITNNVDRRFKEHEKGIHPESYTFSRRPLKLVYVRDFPKPMMAIAFEKQVKRWSRAKKEALINGDIEELKRLSQCMNKTNSQNWQLSSQCNTGNLKE
jgi:putative endonuclease